MTDPVQRGARRRTTLATRIALLSVAIVVVTAVVAGLLAAGLIRNSAADNGRQVLAKLADVAQSVTIDRPGVQEQVNRALRQARVRTGIVGSNGALRTNAAVVRNTVTPADVARLRSGRDISAVRQVDGATVFVEARAVLDGRALVLVQARRDAATANDSAIRRIVLALLVAGAVAAALGLVVAWRLARPLRQTAAAAHSVAAGNRDVVLPPRGPREVVEVSEAVNGIAGALAHSEARQRNFLLSVSHDLRTPLTAITGYAESLADGVIAPAEAGAAGAAMLAEARRLDRLVGDLLDLARLGAQDFRVEVTRVDLVPLAAAAAEVWTARAGSAGVRVDRELPSGPVLVDTDATRLRQALDGLFDNALRVTPADRPVVLALRAAPAAAEIEVRDGGPGLTDADLTVAFDQGALLERYRGVRQVGTGVGLAIVHGLIDRLGGHIEAGHAAEGGARFTIRLPYPGGTL